MMRRTGLRILPLRGELEFASKAKPEHTKVFPRRRIKRSITVLPPRKRNHTDKTLFNSKEKKQEISTRERIRPSGIVILRFEANLSTPQCLWKNTPANCYGQTIASNSFPLLSECKNSFYDHSMTIGEGLKNA